MRQSVLVEPRSSAVDDRVELVLGPEGVLAEVVACGVCASELHGWMGDGEPYPREYGHEVAGIVVEVSSAVQEFRPGMAVTGLFMKG